MIDHLAELIGSRFPSFRHIYGEGHHRSYTFENVAEAAVFFRMISQANLPGNVGLTVEELVVRISLSDDRTQFSRIHEIMAATLKESNTSEMHIAG